MLTQLCTRRIAGLLIAVSVVCLCAGSLSAQATFDGTINDGVVEWSSASGPAVQDNHTGFGNQVPTSPDVNGSELDELFVRTDGTFLYLGITGNLEENGNAIIIFIDYDYTEIVPEGQNTLATEIAPVLTDFPCAGIGPPFAINNLGQALQQNDGGSPEDPTDDLTERDTNSTPTTFDADFTPDVAVAVDTFAGTLSVNQYNLSTAPSSPFGNWDDPITNSGTGPCETQQETLPFFAHRIFRGSVAVESGNGALDGGTNDNSWEAAFNNEGVAGVTGSAVATAGSQLPGDPRSQTSGLEAKLHLEDLGFTLPLSGDLRFRISVLLTSGAGSVSNQVLPGIQGGLSQVILGFRPQLPAVSGIQHATVTETPAAFSPAIDGVNILNEFGVTSVVASQDTVTGFGDRSQTCTTVQEGSELDELYVRLGDLEGSNQFLYVGLTGNLETSGNAQILLLDVDQTAGVGQNTLMTEIAPVFDEPCSFNGPPSAVQGLGGELATSQTTGETIRTGTAGTVLDAGFEPEIAIAVDTFEGTVNVNHYTLSSSALGQWNDPSTPQEGSNDCTESPVETLDYFADRIFRGSVGLNSASGIVSDGTNPNGSEFAYNDTGVDGVSGSAVNDPSTQTTGLEAKISLLDLGFAPQDLPVSSLPVKISALLTSSQGLVSNQVLPGLGGGTSQPNLNFRPDFTTIANNQFASVTLSPATFTGTVDGASIVSDFGAPALLATQDTSTGFGDHQIVECAPVLASGSEMNQMFVQEDAGTLDLAITGNIEPNSQNQFVIFLDTVDGGESLLDANAGRITGLAGNTIPMAAEWALVLNLGGGSSTIYIDRVNLLSNESEFVGSNGLNSGEGDLDACGPNFPNCMTTWKLAFSNTNIAGVNGDAGDDPINNSLNIQPSNAQTATTGVELSIPLSDLGGIPDARGVCVFAILTNGDGGFMSNQVLPAGLGGGFGNYAGGPTDFGATGYECLSVSIRCNDPRYDADGDEDVDHLDFAAMQRCITGENVTPVAPGCECFDFGGFVADNDIDGEDISLFVLCARGNIVQGVSPSGPTIQADPACDDMP